MKGTVFFDPSSKGIQMLRCLTFTNIYSLLPATKRAKRNPENLVLNNVSNPFLLNKWHLFRCLLTMIYWHCSFKMGPLITRYKSRPIITPLLGVRVITPVTYLSKTALLQGSHFTPFFTTVGAVAGGISHTKWPKAYSGCATTMKSERVPP